MTRPNIHDLFLAKYLKILHETNYLLQSAVVIMC